ncbi:MAG: YlmH/Sll1252 family protein [Clostridium sp.]|nr:YlmH/Sll1252 family protein [Acetatifactor muris]MCM1527374.1 YlmH/Sll1252 family protein [Bacteroides sp.]MCM1563562.1 YlmH/Sll1252 family protein [Clostridium sp.]
MENDRELQQIKNRFRELADKSFSRSVFTFTGFLGLSEQSVFHGMERELSYAGCTLFGGREETERKMLRFGDAAVLGYETAFPIVCVHIMPLAAKFADRLSHRDFLGALMNLGIERDTIGDILVGDREAWLFCGDSIAEFICANLEQVRHTHVKCEIADAVMEVPEEEPERLTVQVASMRADAVLAKVLRKSREACLELFRAQKVYVDGMLCENHSGHLRPGATVNARGYGKFKIVGEPRMTGKGKLSVEVAIYR